MDRGLQDRGWQVRVRTRSFRGLQCRQRLVVPGRLELPKTLRGGLCRALSYLDGHLLSATLYNF